MAEAVLTKAAGSGWLSAVDRYLTTRNLIVVTLTLQFCLIFVQGVNWDEFLYLSKIYEMWNGTLRLPVQTIQTRLFFWLPFVPGGEIAQFRVARLFMLGCEITTMACIIAIARRFASREVAWLAGLIYISGGFVFYHGWAFRGDPIAAVLMMSAAWMLLRERFDWRVQAATALLIAMGFMASVKVIFYAPVLLGLGLMQVMQSDQPRRMLLQLAATALLALLCMGALYSLHDAFLPNADIGKAGDMLGEASGVVLFAQWFPKLGYIIWQMLLSPVMAIVVIAAILLIAHAWRAEGASGRLLAITGCMLPISTLVFYTNSYPYFYAFLMPPVMVASVIGIGWARQRYGERLMLVTLLVSTLGMFWHMGKESQAVQREVLAEVHKIFPQPVKYIDGVSMVGSFPKQGMFLSAWVTRRYAAEGKPVYTDLIAQQQPPMLLVNHSDLRAVMEGKGDADSFILPADQRALLASYLHHWGPVYVAGQRLSAAPKPQRSLLRIAGTYTLEAKAPVTINGQRVMPGAAVKLPQGWLGYRSEVAQDIMLRWGDNLYRRKTPWTAGRLYVDFTG